MYINEKFPNYVQEYGLEDKLLKIESRGFLSRLFEINKAIKKENPDLVYTWGNLESIFILLLKTFHKFIFINGSLRHGIRSKVLWHYIRTVILHLSQYIVANSYAGIKVEKLKKGNVLYNGVDEKFIGMISKDKKKGKRKKFLNIDESAIFFISVGNLVPYKDYFSVLDALKVIKNKRYSFFYLILGDGPQKKKIALKIEEYGMTNNVKILGNVQNVNEYLEIADILIHSSKGEGCSNAILEAMFAGLPIIATNVGGTPELVYEKSFRLFDYKDKETLTKILLNVEDEFVDFDPNSSDYQEHLSKFTVDRMMNNYENILNEIISNEQK